MKSYTKTLKTKREIAELMTRPLNTGIPAGFLEKVIEKIITTPEKQFIREARKCTNLDIVPFMNGMYIIRYDVHATDAELLGIKEVKRRLQLLNWEQ
jgi:hypothetical protein